MNATLRIVPVSVSVYSTTRWQLDEPNRGVVRVAHRTARVNTRRAAQRLPAPLSGSRIALELESERLAEVILTRNRAPIVANLISMCFVFICFSVVDRHAK